MILLVEALKNMTATKLRPDILEVKIIETMDSADLLPTEKTFGELALELFEALTIPK